MTEAVAGLLAELGTPAGQADPYPVYERLRALGPVVEAPGDAVVVTGYRECSALLRDPRLRKNPGRLLAASGFPDWEQRPALRLMFTSLLMINPPQHTRLRGLVSRSFTSRRIAELRPAVEAIADRLLDGVSGETDFIDAIAFPFPVTVIGELLGVPVEDRPRFRELVADWSAVLEFLNPPAVETADAAASAIVDYFRGLAARRREEPGDDLVSALVSAGHSNGDTGAGNGAGHGGGDGDGDGDGGDSGGGESLSEEELVTMVALILAAGFETTTGLLANGLVALLAHPGQAERLAREPDLARPAVEELLRYDSPVQMIYGRTAVDDVEVGGLVSLRAGQRVITALGAANRDPAVFDAPGELRLDRDEGGPLSFGAGIHHCLGAALARLEGQVLFPKLLRRFPRIALSGEPEHRVGIAIHSYLALPVELA